MRHLYPIETKRYTVETEINNVASIVDAMIRVTAKLTDMYAGDIFILSSDCMKLSTRKKATAFCLPFMNLALLP